MSRMRALCAAMTLGCATTCPPPPQQALPLEPPAVETREVIDELANAAADTVPAEPVAIAPEVLATPRGQRVELRVRWSGREWSLDPWVGPDMIPSGTPPARLALLVAERGGRLLVAVRCGRQGPERCPTWVGVFEPSGALVFGLHTTDRLPLLSESAFGVAIDTGGEVELRAWSGEVLARFSLGSWTTAARLLDDGAYMWSDGVALHARDADGHERWQLPDTRVAGALGSDLVASTFYDVRVLDAQSGVMRCRRMAPQGALEPAWADVGVLIPHLCQPLPVGAGRLRGASTGVPLTGCACARATSSS